MPKHAFANGLPLNVKDFGAAGNGTADDTAAVAAAIAALAAPANAFGVVNQRLYFPAGRYIIDGALVFPGRVTISGDGPYQTILYRKNAAAGDFVTLNGSNAVIRDLTLDGNKNNATTGDVLVLNGAYTAVINCTITNATLNGITVGKAAGAIAYRIEGTLVRDCKAYGVRVTAGSGSTDGLWSNCDIGRTGLSAVRIDNGAQNLVNVHTWGAGIESADSSDAHGFYVNSSSNSFSNCQAETNRGHGYFISGSASSANSIVGGATWGNRQNGVYILNAPRGVLNAVKVYNNGVGNIAGNTSVVYAGIRNEGGQRWAITGNTSYDSGAVIDNPTYPTAPTNPYIGRAAGVFTMNSHYTELAGTLPPNYNTITGNNWPSEATRSGTAIVTVGTLNSWAGNNLGAAGKPPLEDVFTSPDGTRYKLSVADGGAVSAAAI
jgi:hypothetical protein